MRTAQLRVVSVMMVVRASPNRTGAQDQNAKDPHQHFGQPRIRQYCLMLLIVINHEKPQVKKPRKNTAHDASRQMEVPESSGHRARKKCRGGKNIPPTPRRGIDCVGFGRQYDLFSGSHAGSTLPVMPILSFVSAPLQGVKRFPLFDVPLGNSI